eukprot:452905-Rhodomonas_salina.1
MGAIIERKTADLNVDFEEEQFREYRVALGACRGNGDIADPSRKRTCPRLHQLFYGICTITVSFVT